MPFGRCLFHSRGEHPFPRHLLLSLFLSRFLSLIAPVQLVLQHLVLNHNNIHLLTYELCFLLPVWL